MSGSLSELLREIALLEDLKTSFDELQAANLEVDYSWYLNYIRAELNKRRVRLGRMKQNLIQWFFYEG